MEHIGWVPRGTLNNFESIIFCIFFGTFFSSFVMPRYGSRKYWELRYFEECDHFDWYCEYYDIEQYIQAVLQTLTKINRLKFLSSAMNVNVHKNSKKMKAISVLDLGCGTSQLCEQLFNGYQHSLEYEQPLNVTGIDVSQDCIQFMQYLRKKNEKQKKSLKNRNSGILQYRVQAFEDMKYKKKYDLVIDKASIDSVLCGEDSPVTFCHSFVNQTIRQSLKSNGVFLMISHSKRRMSALFDSKKWSINKIKLNIIRDLEPGSALFNNNITNDVYRYLYDVSRRISCTTINANADEMNKSEVKQAIVDGNQNKENKMESECKSDKSLFLSSKIICLDEESEDEEQFISKTKTDKKPVKTKIEIHDETEIKSEVELRRERRLEYEAIVAKQKMESEAFRIEFLHREKQRLERKAEKERLAKQLTMVINVDQVLEERRKLREAEIEQKNKSKQRQIDLNLDANVIIGADGMNEFDEQYYYFSSSSGNESEGKKKDEVLSNTKTIKEMTADDNMENNNFNSTKNKPNVDQRKTKKKRNKKRMKNKKAIKEAIKPLIITDEMLRENFETKFGNLLHVQNDYQPFKKSSPYIQQQQQMIRDYFLVQGPQKIAKKFYLYIATKM